MEGINILNKIEIYQTEAWAIVLSICAACLFSGGLIACCCTNKKWLSNFFGIIAIASLVCLLVTALVNPKEPTGRYKYQVTIDNSVSITEFYEKYKVIDVNGKIWTIMDK